MSFAVALMRAAFAVALMRAAPPTHVLSNWYWVTLVVPSAFGPRQRTACILIRDWQPSLVRGKNACTRHIRSRSEMD